MTGSHEVRGSIPLSSTTSRVHLRNSRIGALPPGSLFQKTRAFTDTILPFPFAKLASCFLSSNARAASFHRTRESVRTLARPSFEWTG